LSIPDSFQSYDGRIFFFTHLDSHFSKQLKASVFSASAISVKQERKEKCLDSFLSRLTDRRSYSTELLEY